MTEMVLARCQLEPPIRAFSAVLLDRDGTINVKAPVGAYVTSPDELALLPGVAVAISQLNAAALRVVLVTNQRWLSDQPDVTPYERVHARLAELLAEQGAHLDGAYYCPHAVGSCRCRKPAPGMLERAAAEHGFNLTDAIMIGDSQSDIEAGRAAGAATIFLAAQKKVSSGATYFAVDLPEAVRLILGITDLYHVSD